MTIFDYAVLGILAASFLLGLYRGIMSEVLILAVWVAAFIVLYTWDVHLDAYFQEPVSRYYAIGVIVALLFALVIVTAVRLLLSLILKAVGLGLVDRLLMGVTFSVLRGILIVLTGVLIAGMTTLPKNQWWRDAWLAPSCEALVIAAKPWLPVEMAKRIQYR